MLCVCVCVCVCVYTHTHTHIRSGADPALDVALVCFSWGHFFFFILGKISFYVIHRMKKLGTRDLAASASSTVSVTTAPARWQWVATVLTASKVQSVFENKELCLALFCMYPPPHMTQSCAWHCFAPDTYTHTHTHTHMPGDGRGA